jgi:hypothetical protein
MDRLIHPANTAIERFFFISSPHLTSLGLVGPGDKNTFK